MPSPLLMASPRNSVAMAATAPRGSNERSIAGDAITAREPIRSLWKLKAGYSWEGVLVFDRVADQFRHVPHVEFSKDTQFVSADGLGAQGEALRNFVDGLAIRQHA